MLNLFNTVKKNQNQIKDYFAKIFNTVLYYKHTVYID